MGGSGTCFCVVGRTELCPCLWSLTTVGWRLAEMSLAFAVSVWRVAASHVLPHTTKTRRTLASEGNEKMRVTLSRHLKPRHLVVAVNPSPQKRTPPGQQELPTNNVHSLLFACSLAVICFLCFFKKENKKNLRFRL